jgi:hypothetical protein
MTPLKLLEHEDEFTLMMTVCSEPRADEVVESLGHTPNGYFWEGIATLLLEGPLTELADRVEFDCEGDTFVALSADQAALETLGSTLAALLADPNALRSMIEAAIEEGFEFDIATQASCQLLATLASVTWPDPRGAAPRWRWPTRLLP